MAPNASEARKSSAGSREAQELYDRLEALHMEELSQQELYNRLTALVEDEKWQKELYDRLKALLEDSSGPVRPSEELKAQELYAKLTALAKEDLEVQETYDRCKKAWREEKLKQQSASKQSGPMQLLVIEVFAGSHPVGRHFQDLMQAQQQPHSLTELPYSLAAYAAIEAETGLKYNAPEPKALGLAANHHLDLHGKVQDASIQSRLIKFVRRELQNSALQGVVVFGGPPCSAYSKANVGHTVHVNNLKEAATALAAAQRDVRALARAQRQASNLPSKEEVSEAEQRLANALAAKQAHQKALEAVLKDEQGVKEADATVSSFLTHFKKIEGECQDAGNRFCHLVMENPYSIPDKALWNRDFMKKKHLLNLPEWPAAAKIKFRPSSNAWLNTVRQNWCTYGIQYPQKDTIIFTTLTRKAFPDRIHAKHCKHPNPKSHETTVGEGKGQYETAKWPKEFVGAALRACVGEEPYLGL